MHVYPLRNAKSGTEHAASRSLSGLRALREILIVAIAVLVYFSVRGVMNAHETTALANAERLIAFEQRIGLFWEHTIQSETLELSSMATIANWVYIWGHWPVIAATMLWLLFRHRNVVRVYRNAMLISGVIGVICFALFPVAPPRLIDGWGFVDTVTLQSRAYRVLQPPSMTNQFAAMPSLHFGWNLLMGIAIWRHAHGRLPRLFGALMPVVMFAAIILTANHYFVDGLAGMIVAVTGLGLASRIAEYGRRVLREHPELNPLTELPEPGQTATASFQFPQS
ncbi:MAG: phosphatase PAP2 family protein [Chloroflexota bacterium]|nr:phosphatase PAP2 family protein [Chloroflexota bacterium]